MTQQTYRETMIFISGLHINNFYSRLNME